MPSSPHAPIRPARPAPAAGGSCTHCARLAFGPGVPLADVAGTLELALLAAESLHGADRLRLDAAWAIDPAPAAVTVTVDTGTRAGRTLALVFLGYCRREFGARAVAVTRVSRLDRPAGAPRRTARANATHAARRRAGVGR